ncbi:MAG: hypothetical protein IKQ62_03950 [Bacteroidaceae bacterium]|nr:hypothetical protein [Bacteroidaceae bacterium]
MKKNLLHFITGTILMVSILSCTGNKTSGNADASDSTKTDSLKADSTDIIHWQDVSNEEAIAFIEEFYSHAPKEQGSYEWDEAILHKYLAPAVLDTLHALVATSFTDADEGTKYATWLLTGMDNSQQICVSQQNFPTYAEEDGRYRKHFEVYYWADGMLDGVQELYYTVKSDGSRLFITKIDSLDESGAQQVWDMLEERNRWREVERKANEMGGWDNLSEDVIDSLYEHALD